LSSGRDRGSRKAFHRAGEAIQAPIRLSSIGGALIAAILPIGEKLRAADLTGQALPAQGEPAESVNGVIITAIWSTANKEQRQSASTGRDGNFKLPIPDGLAGPVTIKYHKVGYYVIVDEPPPLKNTNSQKLVPVFVGREKVKGEGALVDILKKRAEAVEPTIRTKQINIDVQHLLDIGYEPIILNKAKDDAVRIVLKEEG
jgi:hypothetical protein